MKNIKITKTQHVWGDIKRELDSILNTYKIKRSKFGKPYIEGNPIYFNLSHSFDISVYVISDKPIGIDIELLDKKNREKIKSRLTKRESVYIKNETQLLCNLCAKEAYIKLHGQSIAMFWRLEYFDNTIFLDGIRQEEKIELIVEKEYVVAIATK